MKIDGCYRIYLPQPNFYLHRAGSQNLMLSTGEAFRFLGMVLAGRKEGESSVHAFHTEPLLQ